MKNSISTTISSVDRKPLLSNISITRETTVTVGATVISKTVEEIGDLATTQICNKATIKTSAVGERRDADILDEPNPCQEFPPKMRWSRIRWSTIDKVVEWGWDNDEAPLASQSGELTVRAESFVDASVPVLSQTQSGNSTASSAKTNISLDATTYGPTITTEASQPDKSTALDEYEIIYLCTGERCCSAGELCLGLGTSALFKMHHVVAILPVEDNIWEVLMPARHASGFSDCAAEFGFATEQHSTPKPGLWMRTLLVWMYSGENYLVPLFYISFLKSRPFLDLFKDSFRARILLPKSFVIWSKPYRRIGPWYTVGE
ncbi:hypothetical protein VE04_07963 [Pseudogymnoascus sp. 24MN13]|nr:hypothetical protein VE04_07963 [Pseudogymnoascus sp. 24MN13]